MKTCTQIKKTHILQCHERFGRVVTINLINLEEILWKRSISATGNALFSRERSSNLPKRSITRPSQFPFFFVLMLQAHMCNILNIQAFICILLRGQLSEEVANAGLALEKHFVGLPGLADQYKVDPPQKRSKKSSLHTRQREAFFGAKRSGFGGKRSLQKSKSHLFA